MLNVKSIQLRGFGLYFYVFGLNTKIYRVGHPIDVWQGSEYASENCINS